MHSSLLPLQLSWQVPWAHPCYAFSPSSIRLIFSGVLPRIMRIFIQFITGYTVPRGGNRELDQQRLSLEADENDTVLTVKSLLQQTIHVTPNS